LNLVSRIIDRHFRSIAGELHVGELPVTALATEYGTPLFVYDRAVVDYKLEVLRGALPPEFTVSYSVKANPNGRILRHFVARGCGLEVASAGEFCRALSTGCSPEKILFAGPGKTEAELEYVLFRDIGEIHIESLVEAKRIAEICRRLHRRASVAIRVNPGGEVQGGAMRMGGKSAPFGFDEEVLDVVLDSLMSEGELELCGIHLFTGTQILDHNLLICQYLKGLEIARWFAARLNRPIKTVDLGGGLGIPYFDNDRELDSGSLRASLAAIMVEVRKESCFSGTQFIIEPGRFLVGEAGIYIARVNDIKVSRGKKFVILDGGMNHHLAASGNLGQVIKRNFPVTVVNKLDHRQTEVVDLVGPLCTPLDTLARNVKIPAVSIGDLIGVFQSGAYGRTSSPSGFLSHPVPGEVWIDNGKATLVQARGRYTDFSGGE
jgi:diaminopimelate decarboxylase